MGVQGGKGLALLLVLSPFIYLLRTSYSFTVREEYRMFGVENTCRRGEPEYSPRRHTGTAPIELSTDHVDVEHKSFVELQVPRSSCNTCTDDSELNKKR